MRQKRPLVMIRGINNQQGSKIIPLLTPALKTPRNIAACIALRHEHENVTYD